MGFDCSALRMKKFDHDFNTLYLEGNVAPLAKVNMEDVPEVGERVIVYENGEPGQLGTGLEGTVFLITEKVVYVLIEW